MDKLVTTKLIDIENGITHDTLICKSNGRILDSLKLYLMRDKVIILNNPINSDNIRKHLVKGIPWNRDLEIINGDNAISHLRILGTNISRIIKYFKLDIRDIRNKKWVENGNLIFSLTENNNYEILELLIPINEKKSIVKYLNDFSFEELNVDKWNNIRINLGLIEYEDLSDSIPFDVNKGDLVKLNKGCYPGQEIHARMESRGKMNKEMVIIRSSKLLLEDKYSISSGGKLKIKTIYNHGNSSTCLAIIPSKYADMTDILLSDDNIIKIDKII